MRNIWPRINSRIFSKKNVFSRAEEFEFHWWDHVFNKAAKTIKVDEDNSGEVRVEMNLDKSDLSTKKMRKKARKEMRHKLYSNFVRSGTLTGGKMTSEEAEEEMEVTKDLSKIKELSDEQLVAACDGLTAHKGARHGLNMKAKLDRIAEAEREFMQKYAGGGGGGGCTKSTTVVEEETVTKKSKKKRKAEVEAVVEEEIHSEKKSKKKKKKLKEEIEDVNPTEVSDIQDEVKRKKKKKKDKSKKDSD